MSHISASQTQANLHSTQTDDLPNQTASSYPQNSQDWLKRLIGFDTTSRLSNLALIEEVQAYCQSLGLVLGTHIQRTHNTDNSKANLFVTIPASPTAFAKMHKNAPKLTEAKEGEASTGGIVLSGHTDVVPVDGQTWASDPFIAEVKQDRLYGRGACDMKGFIACCLTVLPHAIRLSKAEQLARPLHLALSYDEEVGCLGAPVMLADLAKRGIKPDYCIVGEPSNMQMVVAHKGINVFRCRVHGKAAHSSLTPKGVNAISYASRLIGYIDELGDYLKTRDDIDPHYDVPFSTLSVGTIKGGTATNIVPNLCEFTFDYRNLPFMSIQEVLTPIAKEADKLTAQMQQVDTNAHIEIEQLEQVPALTDDDSEQLQALMTGLLAHVPKHKINGDNHTDEVGKVNKVAYATEGGQFSQAGIPTVICGPGSIEQAHKPDEYIELTQLDKCDAFLKQLLHSMCIATTADSAV